MKPQTATSTRAVVAIGRGTADFERSRTALAAWKQFDMGWVELFPRSASVEPGTIVAVLIRHLGFWSLNGGRVVYGVGDRHRGNHFGLAYGTLTNHAEGGEERAANANRLPHHAVAAAAISSFKSLL
jgi:uncharacterized protein (UPF0548 family)